jgi:hypothetical protein
MPNSDLDPVDRLVAARAAQQHGVVARPQLAEIGLRKGGIERRVEAGWLHQVHRGVYAVGHPGLTQHGRWIAAVLVAGPGAVLSHGAVAALWKLRPGAAAPEVIAARSKSRRRGVRVHHAVLALSETTTHDGIAVTTAARTLIDLAAVVEPNDLRRALRQADYLKLATADDVAALIRPGQRGNTNLKAVLAEVRPGEITRSDLEDLFLVFVAKYRLPRPQTNVPLSFGVADAVWHEQNLIAELDSHDAHGSRAAFERDRARALGRRW